MRSVWTFFFLIAIVSAVPRTGRNQFCSSTSSCLDGYSCCALCPADAPCGPGQQFAPTCTYGRGCASGYREFTDADLAAISIDPPPPTHQERGIAPGGHCSATSECQNGYVCCVGPCPANNPCGPNYPEATLRRTMGAYATCDFGNYCGQYQGDPNYHEFVGGWSQPSQNNFLPTAQQQWHPVVHQVLSALFGQQSTMNQQGKK